MYILFNAGRSSREVDIFQIHIVIAWDVENKQTKTWFFFVLKDACRFVSRAKAFKTPSTHKKHYWCRTKVRNRIEKRIASTGFLGVPPPRPPFQCCPFCNHWVWAFSGQKFAQFFTKHALATLKMGGAGGRPYWKRVVYMCFPYICLFCIDANFCPSPVWKNTWGMSDHRKWLSFVTLGVQIWQTFLLRLALGKDENHINIRFVTYMDGREAALLYRRR